MTQEERDLLVQYLCMALLYEVMLHIEEVDNSYDDKLRIIGLNHGDCVYVNGLCIDNNGCDSYAIIKPYLRPLSSMTEEEKEEFIPGIEKYQIVNGFLSWSIANYKQIQWFLKKHFDFMDLIPKGLAIEVTEENNPYRYI